jgi:hypothetical protein
MTVRVWRQESSTPPTTTGYGERYRRIAGRGYQQPLETVGATARIPSSGEMRPVGAGQLSARQVGAGHAGAAEAGMTSGAPRTPNGTERNGSPAQVTSNWFRPRRPSAATGQGPGGQARVAGQLPRRSEGAPPGAQPPGGRQPSGQAGGWQPRNGQPGEWQPFQQAPDPVLGGGTTNAGLPVRVPQANRLPNGGRPAYETYEAYDAEADTATAAGPRLLAAPGPQGRSAEIARTRLRGFQHGSRRAEARLPREGEGSGR